ncbi:MAG: HEAT repeat domain-containing protein [Phycisphaerales bacterium]|nr:HEAT repeat domain-containing protein [Phycisphaerales bacterium]
MPRRIACLLSVFTLVSCPVLAQQGDRSGEAQPPLPDTLDIPHALPLSPEDALRNFSTHEGLRVELVAAEPLVIAPVALDLAPDGRIWVVEMPGYMTDLEGSKELEPNGRIVVLEDEDGDGRMDRRTVFLDELVLPRAVHALDDGALVVAPPNLLHARDTDGDGVADETIVLDDTFAGLHSPEHAGNGLRFGMDNWLHCSQHPWEYRFIDGTMQRRAVPAHGQWGTTRDAWDRWYCTPNSYPLMADLLPKHYAKRNSAFHWFDGVYARVPADTGIHPARINPGVNRGYQDATLRDDYTLASFTGACGPEIYLDDTLGEPYRNCLFVCEPCGNCVELRRMIDHGPDAPEARVLDDGRSPLASTDERFRPVHAHAGADGGLYVADLYRGILQHKIFMTTFLRNQVIDRKLITPVDRGRIWRLVPDDDTIRALPDLADLKGTELVGMFEDDRGTVRLLAQRSIVERNDLAAIESLQSMADGDAPAISRAHALWTLAGLDSLDVPRIAAAITDPDPQLRIQAMRLAEHFPDSSPLHEAVLTGLEDSHPGVRRQAAASLGTIAPGRSANALAEAMATHPDDRILRSAAIAASSTTEIDLLEILAWHDRWSRPSPAGMTTLQLLVRTILERKDSASTLRLLELLASLPPDRDWMTESIATNIVDVQRLRTDSPRPLQVDEAPFDWEARLAETPDVAGGLLGLVDLHARWPGREGFEVELETRGLDPDEVALLTRGAERYTHCLGCHQANGRGLRGFYPPLRDSSIVTGDAEPLVAILLHGMEGPLTIDGVTYDQPMPPAPFADDTDIAAVATFIRTSFDNDAGAIAVDEVGRIRASISDHRGPWTLSTLRARFPDAHWPNVQP